LHLRNWKNVFEPDFVGSPNGRRNGMELSIYRKIAGQHNRRVSSENYEPTMVQFLKVILPINPISRYLI